MQRGTLRQTHAQHLGVRGVEQVVAAALGEERMKSLPSPRFLARTSTFRAESVSGTRCPAPASMRSPGMRQTRVLISISVQVAPRTLPVRTAVRTRKRRASRAADVALEDSTAFRAPGSSRKCAFTAAMRGRVWCPRPESNRHGLTPRDFHTTTAFAADKFRLWSGLSLHHSYKP